MSVYLAVDQSTSATKALLFGADGALLDKVAVSHRQIYPRPGWVEHDAEEIYHNTLQATSDLLEQHADLLPRLLSLSLTNQRETFVLFDRATGAPLYNAIVWQCARGEAICNRLNLEGYGPEVQTRTGLKIDTYFPAAKLAWLLAERPDLQRKLADGEALFGTVDTYLIYRLTGGRVYATDHTNASRTLFYDIESLQWSSGLLAIFGVNAGRWPEIRESCAQFGETDLAGRLSQPLPICGVMGDSQAALFAQRCFTPGSAKVTFGSGSSLLLNIGSRRAQPSSASVIAVGWVLDGQPTYALEGLTNFTGATIAWLRDQLELIADVAETEALANAVPDNGGVYLVPAFAGLSAPYWRADARAAILGLSPSSTRRHVVRAALESIAYIVTDVLKLMEEDAHLTMQTIHADGGAVKNRFLMQFVADLTRRTVHASRLPELSALGATLNAMLGRGTATLETLAALPFGYDAYSPIRSEAEVQVLYAGWKRAVQQILS